ncbi:AcrR family transcriptional regulator [Parvibaculum indicum]|uniref:TetR/AcrR family transcriptional regulator n=1 Tax=Parvibaculum indicum TaxID=562969 RepID=UPI00141E30F1|nr:TetR/AcrR family transcriptional regulator [Parvibaculum indicum]NIJ40196.1 AcrR family transcriptional regulator [Parvibaculum indicum]
MAIDDDRADNRSRMEVKKDAQRQALLDAASEMLVHEGPGALSLRKLAKKAGASTMAVYTAFGGKDGLMEALFEEAFDRLAQMQASVPHAPDPMIWLADLGAAYRAFALANPAYYALMISVTMPLTEHVTEGEDAPPARSISHHPAYSYLHHAVEACIEAGLFREGLAAGDVADMLWAHVHGLCSLELAGYYANEKAAQARFDLSSETIMRGLVSEKGRLRLEAR